ncbi:hypothetical protein ACROYT_G015316 [Oculina patagonica]
MGVNYPDVKHVIHLGPARSVVDHIQQAGRGSRKVKEGKRKVLSQSEKAKYYKEHYHIAPELRRGASKWEPPYPEREDEASMTKHKEALRVECHRGNQNKEKTEKWMMLTYPEQRQKMNKQIGIPDLKAK